eukprot:2796717-Pleurochrysis_carterae.AAC.1
MAMDTDTGRSPDDRAMVAAADVACATMHMRAYCLLQMRPAAAAAACAAACDALMWLRAATAAATRLALNGDKASRTKTPSARDLVALCLSAELSSLQAENDSRESVLPADRSLLERLLHADDSSSEHDAFTEVRACSVFGSNSGVCAFA